MIKFTDDFMKKSLAYFGEDYKYPVFASIYCRRGFLSRYNAQTGFVAVTDSGKILVVEYSVLCNTEKEYVFSEQNLEKIKIKKLKLIPVYNVKAIFKLNGKKFKLDITISQKVAGCDFAEQTENAVNFIETLKNWQSYIKE